MNKTWKAPASAREAARQALEIRASKPPSQRGMISTGLARARQLINNDDFTENDIRTMYAWFRRHAVDKKGSTWGEKGKGWQAWHGWGGDAAFSWVSRLVRQFDATKAILVKPYYRDGQRVAGYTSSRSKEKQPATSGSEVVPEQVRFPALYRKARLMARRKYSSKWPSAYASAYMVATYERLVKARGGGKPYRTTKSLESIESIVIQYGQELLAQRHDEEIKRANEPESPDLWQRAVAEAKKRFKVYPSAYANAWAARWYKQRGGKWKSATKDLREWFREEWVDISKPIRENGKIVGYQACGRSDAEDADGYPKCLPKSKAMRLTDEERQQLIARKRKQGLPKDGKPTMTSSETRNE